MDIKKKLAGELAELYLGVPARFKLFLTPQELNMEGGDNSLMVKGSMIFNSGYTFYKLASNPSKLENTGLKFFSVLKKKYAKGQKIQTVPYTGKFITELLTVEKIVSLTVTTYQEGDVIVTEIVSNMNPMALTTPLKKFGFVVRESKDKAEAFAIDSRGVVAGQSELKKGVRISTAIKALVA